jgi:hypothetical protein
MTGKIGRPKAEIDHELIEDLAAIGCTLDEMAGVLRVGKATIKDRAAADPEFAEVERAAARGVRQLYAAIMAQAEAGEIRHAHMARKTAAPAEGCTSAARSVALALPVIHT